MSALTENLDPRYPIGPHRPPAEITPTEIRLAVQTLADLPEQLRGALEPLETDRMNTPYREGGWTVRQLVHHIADSHSTALIRIKMALTADWPVVPGYDEKAFALLPDVGAPVEWSLELIEALHARWVMLLQGLSPEQWKRGFKHAERGPMTVESAVLLYAWHSRHHLSHITQLRKRLEW
jgi:uncharacterized damage-inducible protein DinB